MSLDIFSGFDDHNKVLFDWSYLQWGLVFMVVVFCCKRFSGVYVNKSVIFGYFFLVAKELYGRRLRKQIGGGSVVFRVVFIMLVSMNLLGLLPYVFSLTSHLAINLCISLPLWLGVVFMSMSYRLPSFLAHLQPLGSPRFLNPFLCLIELVRLLVRPITLAVRLTANLRTGHIMISLLGVGFTNSGFVVGGIILVLGLFYYMFEMAVCVIQSYIFSLLPTLYRDEHPV